MASSYWPLVTRRLALEIFWQHGRPSSGVATIARRTGAASQLARASLGYGGKVRLGAAGDDPHLVEMLQDALVLLGGGDEPAPGPVASSARLCAAQSAGPRAKRHPQPASARDRSGAQ